MKTIPVTIGFDGAQTIGTMTIDEAKLPPGASYHFALGYSAQRIADGVPTEVEVREVSLVDDSKFVYADGRGAQPVEPAAQGEADELISAYDEATRRERESGFLPPLAQQAARDCVSHNRARLRKAICAQPAERVVDGKLVGYVWPGKADYDYVHRCMGKDGDPEAMRIPGGAVGVYAPLTAAQQADRAEPCNRNCDCVGPCKMGADR